MNRNKFKHFLLDLREKHGITQADIARAIGVSEPFFSDWVRGKNYRKLYRHRAMIARICGLKVKDLPDGEMHKPKLGKRRRRQLTPAVRQRLSRIMA